MFGVTAAFLKCLLKNYASVPPESGPIEVTSPSFCTTVNDRVYITTLSGNGANGGSQGAVGDRRAAMCGANAAGGGL
jgi:hypothetical protein